MKGIIDKEISHNTPSTLLRVSNVMVFLVLMAVNVISQSGILGSTDTEISARFPTPLTPAT